MQLALMEIGQKSLMQKENRIIGENEISIHEFEDGYAFNDNLKSIFYSKSSLTKKNVKKELKSINLNQNKLSFVSFNKRSNLIPFIFFDDDLQQTYFEKNSLNITLKSISDNPQEHIGLKKYGDLAEFNRSIKAVK